jgi:hypothetical protein
LRWVIAHDELFLVLRFRVLRRFSPIIFAVVVDSKQFSARLIKLLTRLSSTPVDCPIKLTICFPDELAASP